MDLTKQQLLAYARALAGQDNLNDDVAEAIGYWRACSLAADRALVAIHDIATARGYPAAA